MRLSLPFYRSYHPRPYSTPSAKPTQPPLEISASQPKIIFGQALAQASAQQLQRNQIQRLRWKHCKSVFTGQLGQTTSSNRQNGKVVFYAANTTQGLYRNYNQDRISIILNISKPDLRKHQKWPPCSFFGVYDGHGGEGCSNFLRDNLHHFVIKQSHFPQNPKQAIRKGFRQAQTAFRQISAKTEDNSGSCALVVLVIGELCFTANVGDSRAVLSSQGGKQVFSLSSDHKPTSPDQQARIMQRGGKIVQGKKGPLRVVPGQLSVTRSFGDQHAKEGQLGLPGVIIAQPDISSFEITAQNDFIVLGSDGLFDLMSSEDVIDTAWNCINGTLKPREQPGSAIANGVIKQALRRQTTDNVSAIVIGFQGMKQRIFRSALKQIQPRQQPQKWKSR